MLVRNGPFSTDSKVKTVGSYRISKSYAPSCRSGTLSMRISMTTCSPTPTFCSARSTRTTVPAPATPPSAAPPSLPTRTICRQSSFCAQPTAAAASTGCVDVESESPCKSERATMSAPRSAALNDKSGRIPTPSTCTPVIYYIPTHSRYVLLRLQKRKFRVSRLIA